MSDYLTNSRRSD